MSDIAATLNPLTGRPSRLMARRAFGALLAVGCLLGSTEARGQAIDPAVLARAKAATVYIKIKVNGRAVSAGSGFAILVNGGTVTVMTNRHVAVHDEDERHANAKPEIFVVFRSGTPEEQEVPAKLLTYDRREVTDLAMLEVKGVRQPPEPINADRPVAESTLSELMKTISLGFPGGGQINGGNLDSNPAITVNELTISSFRRLESGRMNRIQLNGNMIQGNSGGPIINDKGMLVGVVVERMAGEALGRAIPPNVITSFLGGDIDITFGGLLAFSRNTAKYAIGGRMVDPLGKIGKMSARYVLQSALPNSPKPDVRGRYPIMPGSKEIPLEVRPSTTSKGLPVADAAGYGEVDLTVNTPGDRKLYFQIVLTDRLGRTYAGKPTPATIPEKPEGFLHDLDAETPSPDQVATLAQWSCEVNKANGINMKHQPGLTTISLPGDAAKTISTRHGIYNGPCALVQVVGDFEASVEVLDSFDPGSEGVILPNGKEFKTSFQSTGILVWQDENNYLRLERCKGSDGGGLGMLNQVWVEIYKKGKQAVSQPIDIHELPIALRVIRTGGSVRLLYAQLLPTRQVAFTMFNELAVDFDKEVFVGLAAANFSKRPFEAKLKGFSLQTPNNTPVAVKPVNMTTLVEPGMKALDDGTLAFEGALLKVSAPSNAPIVKQKNMKESYKGDWSADKQLLWNNDKKTGYLKLELPLDKAGKYQIKARFTKASDYAIVKVDINGKPLNRDATIDLYSQDVRPGDLLSLGTQTLPEGKNKFTITVFKKNDKSTGYHVGLDEIQLVPAK
jgi:S1-C subfamily serine protease